MAPDRTARSVTGLDAIPTAFRDAVVAIGNFDGVHCGHQAVVSAATAAADHHGTRAVVLTFEPHPRTHFMPDQPVFRLTPRTLKDAALIACGVDGVLVLPFDAALATVPAEDFVREILVSRLAIRHAVTGYDFHFGHKRQGTPDFLVHNGALHGFGVTIVTEHGDEAGAISSSRIRDALAAGGVDEANALLGWDWSVIETVRRGEARGRTLGFPTANMKLDPAAELRHGIYAVRFTRADGTVHAGVASYGRRPTFDDGAPLLETFLFDFSGDLYGETALVSLVAWLRPEEAFSSASALVEQMHKDAKAARTRLSENPATPMMRRIMASWSAAAAS